MLVALLFLAVIVPAGVALAAWWQRFNAMLPRSNSDFGPW